MPLAPAPAVRRLAPALAVSLAIATSQAAAQDVPPQSPAPSADATTQVLPSVDLTAPVTHVAAATVAPLQLDETMPQPGTLRVLLEHEGAPLRVERIVGTHLEQVPVTTRYGSVLTTVERQDNQEICYTPCTLFLPPTGRTLHFDGDGLMGANLAVPTQTSANGERVVVAGVTPWRPIGGFLLAFLATPFAIGGPILLAVGAGTVPGDEQATNLLVGGVAAAVGGGLATLGVYLMVTGHTRIVRETPLPGPRLLGAAVVPDAATHGATASVAFAF